MIQHDHDERLVAQVRRVLGDDPAVEPHAGATLGSFRLIERLGAGGMGVVWRAEQTRPKRTVALKLIRPTAATTTNLRRFEIEADAVARLDHPSIARIYETGVVDVHGEPHPFLALELIDGGPLVDHASGATLADRLALVRMIAEAIHHAHVNGVIHRDLKPANIIVDREGRPRVLDFGVAKLLGEGVDDATVTGQLFGTLGYMSPEQLDGAPADARSDVFALGAIAYELIGGAPLRELGGLPASRAIDAARRATPRSLARVDRRLGRDIDAVLGMALEPDPARRYASAAALADDLRRVLDDEPVTARRPGLGTHLRHAARRHRARATAAVAAGVILLASAVAIAVFAVRSDRAAAREATQRMHTEEVLRILENLIGTTEPHGYGTTMPIAEPLVEAAEGLDWKAIEPQVALRLRSMLAGITATNWDLQRAALHHAEIIRLRNVLGDTDSLDRVRDLTEYGATLRMIDRNEEALAAHEEALRIASSNPGAPPQLLATVHSNIGAAHRASNRWDEARAAYATSRDLFTSAGPSQRPYATTAALNAAQMDMLIGAHDAAVTALETLGRRLESSDDPIDRMVLLKCVSLHAESRGELGDTDAVETAIAWALDVAHRFRASSRDRANAVKRMAALGQRHGVLNGRTLLESERASIAATVGPEHAAIGILEAGLRDIDSSTLTP